LYWGIEGLEQRYLTAIGVNAPEGADERWAASESYHARSKSGESTSIYSAGWSAPEAFRRTFSSAQSVS
jgi:hypothetical protein